MKLKFVSKLIQIASLRFIEALEGSKLTESNHCINFEVTSYSVKHFSIFCQVCFQVLNVGMEF